MKKKLDAEAARLAPPPPRQQVTDEKMMEASDWFELVGNVVGCFRWKQDKTVEFPRCARQLNTIGT